MNENELGSLNMTRRTFLIAGMSAASSVLILSSCRLESKSKAGKAAGAKGGPVHYGDWRDVYRERWRWDKIVKSSHFINCWYQAHCAWNVYVKDGIVWREEQVAAYEQTNAEVPDANPRGCQKGGCFSERMYDASRLRYPLRRVGERGSGQWKRVSWDEALGEIAEKQLDTILQDGSDRIVWDIGPLYTEGTMTAGHQRHVVLLDSTVLDMNSEIGDAHRGSAETFGKITFERSADDYFYSDLILIWGSNPLYTQIPNAHFLTEARYKGAKLVCIAPDLSASAIHADYYVPVKQGTDAALGLAVAQILIEEKMINEDFMREQTDFPLLVRDDTRMFLRSIDLKADGKDDEFYCYDAKRGLAIVPKTTLALDGLKPELEGKHEVTLRDGKKVSVRTVFSLFKERLVDYTPEKASQICTTPPEVIRKLAHFLGKAKSAAMVTSSNIDKYYHGNLMERSQALVFALTGNFGKKGSGFVGFPWLDHDGIEGFVRSMFSVSDMMNKAAVRIIGGMVKDTLRMKAEGYSEEMIRMEQGRDIIKTGRMTSGALFWYIHAGLLDMSDKLHEWDPYAKRPIRDVLQESFDKGWHSIWPKPGNDPKMLFVMGSNTLRRIRCYPQLLKNLWPKLHTIVTMDMRMSSTALFSDYVLPVAAWYERDDIKWVTPLMPYLHSSQKAASYYETKSDWEIFSRLTEMVDKKAKERGVTGYTDRWGDPRRLDNLYEKFSGSGEFGHTDESKVCKSLIEHSSNLGDLRWEDLQKKGFHRFEAIGNGLASINNATEIKPGETITPLTNHVFKKIPYPTVTRRIQFYIDHELYLEMGEEFPVHKDPPLSGGNYPLTLTGGHTRWSIHSQWRDHALLLRQQRGEPVMFISVEDAQERGISDGGKIRVFNDIDSFEIQAKVSPAVRKGQTIIYHAWDNFQFKDGKGFQNLMPAPLNPVHLAGGQYHLRPVVIAMQPGHSDRDTRVEIEAL